MKLKTFPTEQETPLDHSHDFISAGIACHAFSLIDRLGILDTLIDKGSFSLKDHNPAIKAALLSLRLARVLDKEKNKYTLTPFGDQLARQRGLITMLFDGYGPLLSKQLEIAQGKISNPSKYLNNSSIALASIPFGEEKIDPLLIDVIKSLQPQRTLCDLACGTGDRLLKICTATRLPGLGLDLNPHALKLGTPLLKDHPHVALEKADVAHLKGVWEDVEIVMQSFMLHDIVPESEALRVLKSYTTHFPHFKALLIVDVVAPDDHSLLHMPGFDYVHGLQNIEPRNHSETVSLFHKAGFKIKLEYPTGMPNTYLWVLTRN